MEAFELLLWEIVLFSIIKVRSIIKNSLVARGTSEIAAIESTQSDGAL